MPFAQSVLGPEVGGRAIKANMRQSTLGKSARKILHLAEVVGEETNWLQT